MAQGGSRKHPADCKCGDCPKIGRPKQQRSTNAAVASRVLAQAKAEQLWLSMIDLPPVPEAGKCGAAACTDDDEDCLNMSVQNPRFAFWIDDSKIEDGVDHLDQFPTTGPMKGGGAP